MPGFFFRNKMTKVDVVKKIDAAKKLLKDLANGTQDCFTGALQNRIAEFENELAKPENDSSEKELIMEQYNRFASTLLRCVKKPKQAQSAISSYHSSLQYYPVSIKDVERPNPTTQTIFTGAIALGLILLSASIPAFIFSPVIGAILISAALTCLLPSCLYFSTSDSMDTTAKKAEEKKIFEMAAQIIDPELKFNPPIVHQHFSNLSYGMMI